MGEILTEDIFIDILSRLPAKSLIRFKCVTKRWRSLISDLISDRSFVKLHLQRLKAGDLISSQRIVIGSRYSPLQTVDYEALDRGGEDRVVVPHTINPLWKPRVVGSCDGLVCLLVPGIFLIYNPTTREYRESPVSNFPGKHEYDLFHGFGYDPRSDDYKIVEGILGDENWNVAIFSLKSGYWRTIQVQFQEESHLKVSGQGVYWNGALHWCFPDLFLDERVVRDRLRKRAVIMSFDLSEERFHRELPVPEVDVDMILVELGIHGASLSIYSSGHGPRLETWITDEDAYGRGGTLWTKCFSVACMPAFKNWETPLGKTPIAFTRSGKIVIRMDMDRMILFNPEDNSWKDYPIGRDGLIRHAIYLETLVSPYLDGEPSRM